MVWYPGVVKLTNFLALDSVEETKKKALEVHQPLFPSPEAGLVVLAWLAQGELLGKQEQILEDGAKEGKLPWL